MSTTAQWKQSLHRSLHLSRSKPESKYFQVAGIGLDGSPTNRTMVFRGFYKTSDLLIAITDTRSDKFQEWQKNKRAQICWYFAKSREQYRLSCKVGTFTSSLDEDLSSSSKQKQSDERLGLMRDVWGGLSFKAKEQFLWPEPKQEFDQNAFELLEKPNMKGKVHNKGNDSDNNEKVTQLGVDDTIPACFCVVVFRPYIADYLCLKTNPQTRVIEHDVLINNTISENINDAFELTEGKFDWYANRVNP